MEYQFLLGGNCRPVYLFLVVPGVACDIVSLANRLIMGLSAVLNILPLLYVDHLMHIWAVWMQVSMFPVA